MFIMINLHHVQITYCNYDCFHIFCKDLWNVNKYKQITLRFPAYVRVSCPARQNRNIFGIRTL